jgi:hypothetical protein
MDLEGRLHNIDRIRQLEQLELLDFILPVRETERMTAENRTWQELCEAASKEPDPQQLMVLVAELVKALDQSKQFSKQSSNNGSYE